MRGVTNPFLLTGDYGDKRYHIAIFDPITGKKKTGTSLEGFINEYEAALQDAYRQGYAEGRRDECLRERES
jgi:hypothetical protein